MSRDAQGRETITPAQLAARKPAGRRWSSARRTVCAQGHGEASRMQARVCDRLHLEARVTGARVYRQVRLPLLALAPKPDGTPHVLSIDFVVVEPGKPIRYVEAKDPRRVSRDWRRGAAAFAASWGPIEEVSQ